MAIDQREVNIRSLGDSALVVQLGEGINPLIHEKVINLIKIIESDPFTGFIEAVPCYNSVTIFYDPVCVHFEYKQNEWKNSFQLVSAFIMDYIKNLDNNIELDQRIIEIPVVYGEEFGPDLDYVAHVHKITPEKVIDTHSRNEYMVYMIGFAPGFPFLGGMNKEIATPRKESPRLSIAAGSVGIAGEQTGVYPVETPGGWQIIGRSPLDLFLPKMSPPTLLQSGDKIRFVPITADEYTEYKERENNEYKSIPSRNIDNDSRLR